MTTTPSHGNPYLPLWEYIPDGEPYVFEDPDNPGKYRLYIYGSHDTLKTEYCGHDLVTWSAPVENLNDWRRDGIIFQNFTDGTPDLLYAPDVALVEKDGRKTYYLYPNNMRGGKNSMVAKSARPDGPFEVINWKDDSKRETYGVLGFDPVVFVDDDGSVYGYWGFCGSFWAQLDPDNMADVKKGCEIRRNIPSYDQMTAEDYDPREYNIVQDENVRKWGFFEASSIRKVGNKYVFIYSRNGLPDEPTGKNYNQLAYGYSDSPAGPWKWGGIVVDAQGETLPRPDSGYSRTFPGGNTHGSICEVNGQWYVFYHRNIETFARQAMAEKITVEWDENPVSEGGEVRITPAEVTSEGFCTDGLNPYVKISAGRACYLIGSGSIKPEYDENTDSLTVVNLKNNSVVGFKYLNFDMDRESDNVKLEISVTPKSTGRIDVYMRPVEAVNTPIETDRNGITSVGKGSEKICFFDIAGTEREVYTNKVNILKYNGKWGVFFVFNGGSDELCDFHSFCFVKV